MTFLIGSEAIYFTSIKPDNETSQRGLNQEMLIRFCVRDIVGVSIIDSIPHCQTENALKKDKIINMVSFLYRRQQ